MAETENPASESSRLAVASLPVEVVCLNSPNPRLVVGPDGNVAQEEGGASHPGTLQQLSPSHGPREEGSIRTPDTIRTENHSGPPQGVGPPDPAGHPRPDPFQTCILHQSHRVLCTGLSAHPGPHQGLTGTDKNHVPSKMSSLTNCGAHLHPLEETFAAYCHPPPVLAPAQLHGSAAPPEPPCSLLCAPAAHQLVPPRLVSSLSETGLDHKHLMRCCSLSSSWISPVAPGSVPHPECCDSSRGASRSTGTMTAQVELRSVAVQTVQGGTPHVYPQVCVTDEIHSQDKRSRPGAEPKTAVKEVKWDAEGMTWEVYGASVDPEELGLAIQRHLELQIKETASRAAKLSRQNTNTSRQSRSAGTRPARRRMDSISTLTCCTGGTATAE
ncbi:GRIN2-like protein isoform X1 [Synchiropus splendidus]|uniref:GRIN2-like protein isoform X1 n=2 Tax=Synchiropus splendidus TaxID=270530 RepID=UPI00237DBDDA|nr:GRIN2-like protein isoform X1 [Synchiropus splendidus]